MYFLKNATETVFFNFVIFVYKNKKMTFLGCDNILKGYIKYKFGYAERRSM